MFSGLVVRFLSICGIYGSDTSAREGHSAVVPFSAGDMTTHVLKSARSVW